MARLPTVELRIYPDDCDAYGHVNQAAFLRLFERARWDLLAGGPGMEVFGQAGAWPAIRRASVEYYAPAFPGDVLSFDTALTHLGRTSLSLHQLVRRTKDRALVAAGHFVAICIDQQGRPVSVPDPVRVFFGVRPAIPCDTVRQVTVRGAVVTVESQGDGETILFIHGFPFDGTMWRSQVCGLPGWNRLSPDLPGFGLSDLPSTPWRMADYADDIARLLDELQVEKAIVCALSMGGYIAFDLWRRHRARIRGLILADTKAEADSREGKRQRDATIELVNERGSAALVDVMMGKLLAPSTVESQPRVAGHVRSMIADTSIDGVVAALGAMRDREDSVALLGSIDVPTLVVAGAEDAIIPVETQRDLARRIPGATFQVVQGAGHLSPLEQPDAFNRIVAAFLKAMA